MRTKALDVLMMALIELMEALAKKKNKETECQRNKSSYTWTLRTERQVDVITFLGKTPGAVVHTGDSTR